MPQKIQTRTSPKRVVVIGGGTGTFTVLSGLKKYPNLCLTAIVSMADDGGSTGILRDELGALPPGDVRQCLVALSEADELTRKLFNYRFENGGLSGHSFGNLLITALEKVTGSFDEAVVAAAKILNVRGEVIPVTLKKTKLVATLDNGQILKSEHELSQAALKAGRRVKKIVLKPNVRANPKALAAIGRADLIVIGPGDVYGSLLPNLLVQGIPSALKKAKAKKVYVSNLMAKEKFTSGFQLNDFLNLFVKYLKANIFNDVVYNSKLPSPALLRRYRREGHPILPLSTPSDSSPTYHGADLVNRTIIKHNSRDKLKNERTFIRHNAHKLARVLVSLL